MCTDYHEILIPFIRHEERIDGTYLITDYFYPTQGGTAPIKTKEEKILIIPDCSDDLYTRGSY